MNTEHKTSLSSFNIQLREDLIDEGIITGRDGLCGNYINPERFPPSPIKMKCDRYFCPVCGFEKVDLIRRRVSYFNNQFQRDGGVMYLLTFTIPHNNQTDLKDLYSWYSQSISRLKNTRLWKDKLKTELDSQFNINRYETVISPRNSFHLHLHIIIGGYKIIDTDYWKKLLTTLWRRCCKSVGVKRLPSKESGVDIRKTVNGTYFVGKEKMELDEKDKMNVRRHFDKSNRNMKQVFERKQDSYTPEDLQKILTGYKRTTNYKHQDFSMKEVKKYLKKYKKVMFGKKYMKIVFDNDDFKWKWNNNSTIEDFLI